MIDDKPVVLPSARKHGVADKDARHAFRYPKAVYEMGDDMTMYVGPAEDGTLLEVGAVVARDTPGEVFIAHAMKAREKFLPSKPGRSRRKR